jgi:hypothetical protein
LALAEELLTDIELGQLAPMLIARKTSRLARLLDDESAMRWLAYEAQGYILDENNNYFPDQWEAAVRSRRHSWNPDSGDAGRYTAPSASLGQMQAWLDAARVSLTASADPAVSLASANPTQFVGRGPGNSQERAAILKGVENYTGIIERVMGAFHAYVSSVYQELRFGSAVESAFATVRAEVDQAIARLIPDGLPKLTAALEAASSSNPEHWANAAGGCRRLLMTAADALQPPSDPVNNRPMTEQHYVNRLMYWIEQHQPAGTARSITTTELELLGNRLDATSGAGHKGAHAEVTRGEAARYITSTYLLLGDILRLAPPEAEPTAQEPVTRGVDAPDGAEPLT